MWRNRTGAKVIRLVVLVIAADGPALAKVIGRGAKGGCEGPVGHRLLLLCRTASGKAGEQLGEKGQKGAPYGAPQQQCTPKRAAAQMALGNGL